MSVGVSASVVDNRVMVRVSARATVSAKVRSISVVVEAG